MRKLFGFIGLLGYALLAVVTIPFVIFMSFIPIVGVFGWVNMLHIHTNISRWNDRELAGVMTLLSIANLSPWVYFAYQAVYFS